MSQMQSFDNAPAASLVGSMGVFTLADVLTLLAESTQTGELQVVGSEIDGRVWLEEGELSNAHVGSAATIGRAVFELAILTDGWFYFTSGLASSSGQPRVPVRAVLDEVRPQVDEWHELLGIMPFESTVALSPNPPNGDVQLHGDQWRMVTSIGNAGTSVKGLLGASGEDRIAGLRILRDLHHAGLITLEVARHDDEATDAAIPFASGQAQDPPFVPTASPFSTPDAVPPVPPYFTEIPTHPEPPGSNDVDDRGDTQAASLADVAIIAPSNTPDV
jgi:hypothetical protein